MKSGIQKPPLAPKPKLSELSPSTPRRVGLPHPRAASPSTPNNRGKPALAPKPCLSKLSAAALVVVAPDSSNSLSPKKSPGRQFMSSTAEKPDNVPKNVGLQNSKNGIQQENKKPDWDYIIPICLCTRENCQCVVGGNATDRISGKSEKDVTKKLLKGKTEESARSQVRADNREEKTDVGGCGGGSVCQVTNVNLLPDIVLQSTYCSNNNSRAVPNAPVQNKRTENKNLKPRVSDASGLPTARPSLPLRTWSDEANGNVGPKGPGEGSVPCSAGPTSIPASHAKKTHPVPSPRKPRKAALARQEKAEEEEEDGRGGGGGGGGEEMSGREVKEVSTERKSGLSSPPLSVDNDEHVPQHAQGDGTAEQTSRKACPLPPPAPPPRKKPFLSTPDTKTRPSSSFAPCSSSTDAAAAEEENLVCNGGTGVYEMECSVDGDEDFPPPSSATGISNVGSSVSPEKGNGGAAVKVAPKKPQRHSAHMAWMLEKEEHPSGDVFSPDVQDGRHQSDMRGTRELPLLPPSSLEEEETTRRSLVPTPAAASPPGHSCKAPRSALGKQRAKSFSSADLIHAEASSPGQKKNSLRRLLDLKLSVKMLQPKLKAKGQTAAECVEQCVDGDLGSQEQLLDARLWAARKFSCPQIGFEQNVDGDEFFCAPGRAEEQCVDYENSPHYEEIADYVNLPPPARGAAPAALQTTAWQNRTNDDDNVDDENIYEEQEPYLLSSLQKHIAGHQQKHNSRDRGSVDDDDEEEEVAVDHDASWGDDDDINMTHSSEEEEDDDDSSTSSKGDPAHHEEEQGEAESGPKKSKIHHIATEIMSSEKVFVDVLKLLHIDFRDAVSKASRQSGKPVMEERILNQILYNLPQLYELNQDLLRELEQRVAKWNESARLADIFVKKGPYLKMYSTYIREFDKNVTQLEEQTKRNSAFASVLREFEASPRCANLALRHYLLKPIQRIPQYQLLLTDYLKNLPLDSVDYKDTQAALGIVKEVANHANDIMKQGDNFQKVIQVQCRLNGHHEIVQPGRVFLKEGILMKLSRKVMQPRTFFLFNDTLLYTTPVQSGQYKLNNMLSLAGMKVSKPNQEAYQNELKIESVERSFILSASSASERDAWLEAISMAINDYTRKKITFISGKAPEEIQPSDSASLGSIAPIWIPDLRATMCMICTCEFTLTWRRHHCRACGKVVCQACSSNKYYLEYLKNQLARVCDQCFTVLQQKSSEQAQAMALSPGPSSKSAFAFSRKQKKIPSALKEVTANTDNSSMSGYLQRSKASKRQVKRLWFVIKDKVLYTYAACEDVAALESQPLLGFVLKEDSSQKLQFRLYHKNTLYYIFKADDIQTAQRWIDSFKEAAVL